MLTKEDCEELKKMGWSEQEIETLKELNKDTEHDTMQIPFDFDLPGDDTDSPNPMRKHKCNCTSKDLFHYGCKCGGV